MPTVLITYEGINLSRRYIIREMSVYIFELAATRHYFFHAPTDLHLLQRDRQTERYHRQILGGIPLTEYLPGALSYDNIETLLTLLADHRILVVGNLAMRFTADFIPDTNIQDIQEMTFFTYPPQIPAALCGHNHANNRHCSLGKLWYAKTHVLSNNL